MGYPRYRRARSHKMVRRLSGDVAITSTTYGAIDTALDMALEAQIGDVIEYGVNAMFSNEAIPAAIDVATWVSGAAVNYFSTGTATAAGNGVVGWYGIQSIYAPITGPTLHTVTAGDISGGLVTLRLLARVTTAGTRTMFANSASNPLQAYAKNLGPVDPN